MADEQTPVRRSFGSGQVIFWLVVAVLVAGLYAYREWRGPDLSNQGAHHPAVGLPLTMLRLQGLTDGTQAVELSDLKGKVVLLNFWGVWCPPCLIELPHMAELYKQFSPRKDFRLLAVSCPYGDSKESIGELRNTTIAFLNQEHLQLPAYADFDGTTSRGVSMAVELNYLPTTVLLGRDGKIRGAWVGYHDGVEAEMKQLITAALAEKNGDAK